MTPVIVIGAGPVGLLLAAELTRRGVRTVVLERRPSAGDRSRAIGVHAPVLAALEDSGTTDRLLAEAVRVSRGECRVEGRLVGTVRFDRLSRRFPFVATLPQPATEAALAHGAPEPLRDVRVTSVQHAGDRVRVRAVTSGGEGVWEAGIVVVAGGAPGRDLVFRPGGVPLRRYPDRYLMADTAIAAPTDVAVVSLARDGVLESFPLPGGRRRFVAWDGRGDESERESIDRDERLRRALPRSLPPGAIGDTGADGAITGATSFRVRRVVAPRLRRDRVLVVGDAAHEVSPIGGQGMNLGLLDAVALAPLLAEWVRDGSPPEAALRRWERARVTSARTAAAIAAVNTSLGRPRRPTRHALRTAALGALLRGPGSTLLAHAYAMGFDRDA